MKANKESGTNAGHWSNYWRDGAITTFAGAFANNYDDDIKDFWFGVYNGLEAPPGRIVDLATGNGAVALLMAEASEFYSTSPDPEIIGVDYANVREPASGVSDKLISRVRFLGNTPIEKLPFEDASADLVTSQFGFEYADQGEAVKELARIMAPGATGAFIVHHTKSRVVTKAQESADLYRRLLVGKGFFPRLAQMVERLIAARASGDPNALARDPAAQRDREQMNAHLAEVYRYARRFGEEHSIFGVVQRGLQLFADKSLSPDALRAEFKALRRDVDDFRRRMQDMRSAAHTRESLKRLTRSMNVAGIDLQKPDTLTYQGRPFGWSVRFRRRG